MLKGLAITPPVLGRISIGKVIEKNGKRLPEKDDQFTITSQVQGKDGKRHNQYGQSQGCPYWNRSIFFFPLFIGQC
ncbi:hypothetical protein AB1A96_06290 [Pseudomonas juntendi]|uniref:recombination directionality factor n=1 Tax=Pseudomonas juntendi TaxID=2666183 RepID=UPI003451ADF5